MSDQPTLAEKSALEALAHTHDLTIETRKLVAELLEATRDSFAPARPITLALTTDRPSVTDPCEDRRSLSIGIFNPTDVVVFIGIDGGPASSRARSLSCSPRSLLVLPISSEAVTLATEDDLGGGDAVITLLRFPSVQPAFLGAI